MGLGKKLKKVAKQAGKALTDPKNAVNMMSSAYLLPENIDRDRQRAKAAADAQEAAIKQAEAEAAEQEFQNDLDHKRRVSTRTNIIFAGILGDNDEIGLGGQKNLLGL